jgi:hypothetical protein
MRPLRIAFGLAAIAGRMAVGCTAPSRRQKAKPRSPWQREPMEPKSQQMEEALDRYFARPDRRSYVAMTDLAEACASERCMTKALSERLEAAVLQALTSPDWRLAREAMWGVLWGQFGSFAWRADRIVEGLFSRHRAVWSTAAFACGGFTTGPRLARTITTRLEALQAHALLTEAVLEAVDNLASVLDTDKDRARLVQLLKRVQPLPTRSRRLAWEVGYLIDRLTGPPMGVACSTLPGNPGSR